MMVYRHQFDRGDAQILQVVGWCGSDAKPLIGSTHSFGKIREQFGEAFDMHFVNHRLVPRECAAAGHRPR